MSSTFAVIRYYIYFLVPQKLCFRKSLIKCSFFQVINQAPCNNSTSSVLAQRPCYEGHQPCSVPFLIQYWPQQLLLPHCIEGPDQVLSLSLTYIHNDPGRQKNLMAVLQGAGMDPDQKYRLWSSFSFSVSKAWCSQLNLSLNSQQQHYKGWLAIAELKPLSFFISLS